MIEIFYELNNIYPKMIVSSSYPMNNHALKWLFIETYR